MLIPASLDARIAALSPEIDEALRREVQTALATLRKAENAIGVILSMPRMSLLLLDKLFATVVEQRPSSNLFPASWCRRHRASARATQASNIPPRAFLTGSPCLL